MSKKIFDTTIFRDASRRHTHYSFIILSIVIGWTTSSFCGHGAIVECFIEELCQHGGHSIHIRDGLIRKYSLEVGRHLLNPALWDPIWSNSSVGFIRFLLNLSDNLLIRNWWAPFAWFSFGVLICGLDTFFWASDTDCMMASPTWLGDMILWTGWLLSHTIHLNPFCNLGAYRKMQNLAEGYLNSSVHCSHCWVY